MKSRIYVLFAAFALMCTVGFTSCSDDDFTETIFDPTEYPLDRTQATFPLDTFVKKNFLEPYNLRYLYKMEDISSDMNKNLVPCTYENSVKLAVLAKYLWYDVYAKLAGEEFLKEYSPRIIHVIGSPSYNPQTGTVTLGEAEGGLKITIYNANNLNVDDIDNLNERLFKTMHHEFSHILHQNKVYPNAFSEISNGKYNPMDWEDACDSLSLSSGFVSNYASSQVREDWVEVIANYIVKDADTWNGMLNTATYGWEVVQVDKSLYDRQRYGGRYYPDSSDKTNYIDYLPCENLDSLGYYGNPDNNVTDPSGAILTYEIWRKVIERDANDKPIVSDEGKIVYIDDDGIDGQAIILQKLDMAKTWLKENFNLDLDALRNEVQQRQYVTNDDGTFIKDSNGRYINRLTYPVAGSSETLMDQLLNEVYKFKELQNQ